MTVMELIHTLEMISNPGLPVKLEGKNLGFQVVWNDLDEIILEDTTVDVLINTSKSLFNMIH